MTASDPKASLAGDAWRLMFGYLMQTSPDRARSLEERGLTPNDARALWNLEPDEGRPIGSLARLWGCDPSNATFIVDRLTRAGLAERRTAEDDRRVKLVVLTPLGAKTKQEILEEHSRPPESLQNLSENELTNLIKILGKLPKPEA
jgi:DNA-binding MarR family transcriptional regulator